MKRTTRWTGALTLILIIGATAAVATAAQIDPDELINMDLKSAGLIETLQSFAQISGSRLDAEESIAGAVTLTLERTPWRRVLDRVCRDHRLRCEILSGEPSVLRVRSTESATGAAAQTGYIEGIELALKQAELRSTLQAFGMIGQREVIVDDDVTGTLTLFIRDAPWTVVLEEACNLSGCRVEWGESELRIRRAEPSALYGRRASERFEHIPAADALAAVAGLPIFGILGQPELDLAGDLEEPVDVELVDVNWQEALNALCDAAACEWQLAYGAPSRLTVKPKVAGLDDPVALPATATTLEAAAAELARALGLEIAFEPGLDPESGVRFTAANAIWRDAAADLCRQAACFWSVEDRRLTLRPKVKALAGHPAAGAEDRRLAVRFHPPGAAEPVTGMARFNWASPVRTFESGGDERWLARLSWIPFGPYLQLVLPTIIRCGEEPEVYLLEPVRLPLDEPHRQQRNGAIVELSSPGSEDPDAPGASGAAAGGDCLEDRGDRIQATFRPGTAEETRFDVAARVGTYLLLTPPADGRRAPVAAILSLGADSRGRQRIALVQPSADGAEVAVEHRTLPADDGVTEKIATPDREIELALRHLRP